MRGQSSAPNDALERTARVIIASAAAEGLKNITAGANANQIKRGIDKAVAAIRSGKYDLIVLNFANPDMVGHTGSLPAAIKAVETGDAGHGRIAGALPRAVNFISGPSRTADIEQTVTLGAHGPARVYVVLVG